MNDTHLSKPDSSLDTGTKLIHLNLLDGLATGALHEIYADDDDQATAIGFGLLIALRSTRQKPVVIVQDERCIRAYGRLYGLGLVDLGFDPQQLIIVRANGIIDTLRAGADAVRCTDVGCVVIQPWRSPAELDLTVSRRIALYARRSGVMALIICCGSDPQPSAATTRWRVCGAPSTVPDAYGPGQPTFKISLLRHRFGFSGFDAHMEWNRDRQNFSAPLSCGVPAMAASGAEYSRISRAA